MAEPNTGQASAPGSNSEPTAQEFESLLGGADNSEDSAALEGDESGQEDEGTEADSEEGDEPQTDEEEQSDEDEDEPDQEPAYTVKIDGKEEQVKLKELVNGYQRNADYTRKSQALADARKVAESEFAAVQQERARYAQILDVAEQRLMQAAPPEKDWEKLRTEDPITFAAEWAQYQRVREHHAGEYQRLQAERQRLAQVQRIDQQRHLAAHVEAEQGKLLAAIPAWKDPKVAGAEKKALLDFGTSLGFTQEELDGVYDHRAVVALYNAMKYDTLQKRQPTVRKVIEQAKSRVLEPGSVSTQPKGSSMIKKAQQRLAQSGRVSDAADLFEQMLG